MRTGPSTWRDRRRLFDRCRRLPRGWRRRARPALHRLTHRAGDRPAL